jgi:hypothetical protein
MTMYQATKFDHNGEEYEVRAASDGHTIHVRAFKDGQPANGYSYSLDVLTQTDAQMSDFLIDPLKEMIKTAESDVRNGVWECYVAAAQASGTPY